MGVLKRFFQDEFLDTFIWEENGLAKYGYVYYPNTCYDSQTTCKVHMHLHGCAMTVDGLFSAGIDLLSYGGFFEYAASNNIIVIMPQVKFDFFINPTECFDYVNYASWWSDTAFATKNGIQPKALKNMLDRLTEPIDPAYNYQA